MLMKHGIILGELDKLLAVPRMPKVELFLLVSVYSVTKSRVL
jgi:hypothetical protein